MNVQLISIDSIELSQRSMNALHRAGVHTVGVMLEHTRESLSDIRNLGAKSIEEILEKIEEYKNIEKTGGCDIEQADARAFSMPENMDVWLETDDGKKVVSDYFEAYNTKISEIDYLSAKAYNLLVFAGYEMVYQIINMTISELMQIPKVDEMLAKEIKKSCHYFTRNYQERIIEYCEKIQVKNENDNIEISIFAYFKMPEYHDAIIEFVKSNDKEIERSELGNRPKNQLIKNGYKLLSDIIFMTRSEFQRIPAMGVTSIEAIEQMIFDYLQKNESKMIAYILGDESALWDDSAIEQMILDLYHEKPFYGFSFADFKESLQLDAKVSDDRLKSIIGGLLASEQLEYVDYRCYRVYESFQSFLSKSNIDARSLEMIESRLQGDTLDEIGKRYDLTRERVRQIVKRDVEKIKNEYSLLTGMDYFDEDYYQYFYSNYNFDKKVAEEWFGISQIFFHYMELTDVRQGKKELVTALEDYQSLNVGLRLKIKNYLNRDKIFIDNRWVEKKRIALEEVVVKRFCRENVSFDDFVEIYNDFLRDEEIPYDEKIYYTKDVLRTRKNILSDSHFLLWKQNEQIRYYDIDGRDYTELLDTLNLSSYENIELSTLKFMEDYPEIMDRFDIRDQYELHNLLRKIVPEGSYHDFHCGRMPMICFGAFDRDEAILDLLIDNAPISQSDLCELIHKEYGYDPLVVQASYLKSFTQYYHNGSYIMDQKIMPEVQRKQLKELLTEDFYYIDRIREIYRKSFPDGDVEMVNPYNLKRMGFTVLSKYAVQNHSSLEAYCEHILTNDEIIDITKYRKQMVYVQMFSQKLMELKRKLEVIEFEPNQIINISKLEKSGVTRADIGEFCDAVYDFVDDDTYFSMSQIKSEGFNSALFELGFSDWFYSNLLVSDERFSFGMMFGNLIFYKGRKNITIKNFIASIIRDAGVIDTFDLMNELTDIYGCSVKEKWDVLYRVQGTEIYYDKILDRFYKNENAFEQELEQMGGVSL